MAAGQLWFSQLSPGSSYGAGVLPGLLFTALGIGFALPTASIAITSGVQGRDQGLAGALFTTSQQVGAAVGLASSSTVHQHLANLERAGLIRRDPSKPRALELLDQPRHRAGRGRGGHQAHLCWII